jgi:hypothetical protein
LAQRFLLHPALGQIAGHLRKAEQLAFLPTQRGDDYARPKTRAVLAHPPSLVLEAPLALRHAQFVLGPTPRHVFGHIEDRKMLADDLVGGVALGKPRADVPRGDMPFGVEHENRVVARLLDKDFVYRRIDRRLRPAHAFHSTATSPLLAGAA